ncbi:MAG TPA: bifunctional alpha,alpha-trehalose-phosphate synthase (UDP-forming)/trehalose-phosphatase [Cytophagaceae bacterium]|jgi:trehalose 6-phosphate synthase/phosphatase|nr:bifunctional alpha,alpha-trehalose-phosphate synthase (UDP-forming)/trehalose-phosphatase [Cytophagaceae bacterium]
MAKTIIVSNRLPVSIEKKDGKLTYVTSAGGLATGLGSIYKQGDNIWIGWPGLYLHEDGEKAEVEEVLKKENMAPVYLTKDDIEKFYEGFSNSTLWPLFHYFPKYVEFEEEYWESYKYVNTLFCEAIIQHAEKDDIIWIHDYQLLLLPSMIREKLPEASIGFFQHIPFPSYEIFRILPWREELLKGMLGADLLGFHTYDDVRHFLSAVSRITGIDNKMGEMRVGSRLCNVDSFPMGIDYQKFENAALSPDTIEEIKKYRDTLGSQKLIISIDRLDYSKGIPERLKALYEFLSRYPEYKEKISLIFVLVPSRDKVPLYKQLKMEIDELVGRINGKFGTMSWTPVYYFYRGFPFQSLSAFYTMSDVALVTPLRDGMNLVCKEYIASKTDQTGVLILSEMAGAAKELSEAIIVNPHDINQIVDALHQALTMPKEEQQRRNYELQNILRRYDIHHWVHVFMQELEEIKDRQRHFEIRRLNYGLRQQIVDHYKSAKSRLIFLDYDGTLIGFNADPRKVAPDDDLKVLMNRLSADPKNKIVIISGRDKDTLEDWFGNTKIDMIAEHGVWLKEGRIYWSLIDYLSDEWKKDIRPILELYVDRTPGSFIETKDFSLVWHYRKADKALGELRSRELINNLQYLTTNMPIKILEGNKVVEVKNAGINKGVAALRWLHEPYDFILAAGDDLTDEDTFSVMPESSYTLKVGYSPSIAHFNISSVSEMRGLLRAMLG